MGGAECFHRPFRAGFHGAVGPMAEAMGWLASPLQGRVQGVFVSAEAMGLFASPLPPFLQGPLWWLLPPPNPNEIPKMSDLFMSMGL